MFSEVVPHICYTPTLKPTITNRGTGGLIRQWQGSVRLLASQVRVLKNPIVETKIFLNLVANEYTKLVRILSL